MTTMEREKKEGKKGNTSEKEKKEKKNENLTVLTYCKLPVKLQDLNREIPFMVNIP